MDVKRQPRSVIYLMAILVGSVRLIIRMRGIQLRSSGMSFRHLFASAVTILSSGATRIIRSVGSFIEFVCVWVCWHKRVSSQGGEAYKGENRTPHYGFTTTLISSVVHGSHSDLMRYVFLLPSSSLTALPLTPFITTRNFHFHISLHPSVFHLYPPIDNPVPYPCSRTASVPRAYPGQGTIVRNELGMAAEFV